MPATFDFSEALRYIKGGHGVARKGWSKQGLRLILPVPEEGSQPFLIIEFLEQHGEIPVGGRVAWLPDTTDLLSEDWYLYEEA